MTHAGTMDLGGSARGKQSGSPWPAIALTLAVVVAVIGAVWFASTVGIVGGTGAKPVADRSYDAIEAQRGAITLSGDRGYDPIEAERGFVTSSVDRGYDPIERLRIASGQALTATQYNVSRLAFSMASGTSDPGKAADDLVIAPVDRPGVSGP
jgi:hypothetical protein